MKSVGIALGIVVAGVVALGVVLLRDPAPHDGSDATSSGAADERGRNRDGATPSPATSGADRTATDAARTTETGEPAAPADGTDESAEFRGEGSITLAILDDASGAPIADLPYIVYSERPRLHVYTRGVTDEKGEATIGELPEDVVIFETPRRPPHANSIFATWLSPRQRKRVQMRVGRGGTVRGRVVDDVGTPLRDIEIVIDPRPGNSNVVNMIPVHAVDAETARRFTLTPEVVAHTSADGRFEVPALLSRVAAIWIEDGRMSPRREEPYQLVVRDDFAMDRTGVMVHEGEISDVGDVVLARSARLAGRVVDESGAAVAGALLSARGERYVQLGRRILDSPPLAWLSGSDPFVRSATTNFWLRPGEAGFELARGETLTGGDGSFEVETHVPTGTLLVATADARRQWFSPPAAEPGGRVDGIELKLAARTLLVLDLRDPSGNPLPKSSRRNNTQLRAYGSGETIDGQPLRGDTARIDDVSFGLELYTAPSNLRSLTIFADDFEPTTIELDAPPARGQRFELMLVPVALFELRFRFAFADPGDWKRLGTSTIQLSAGPRPDPSGELVLATGAVSNKAPHDGVITVRSEREWFVVAEGPFDPVGESYVRHPLGAFRPGGAAHEITLPPVSAAWVAAREREQKEREEAEKARRERPKPGVVVVRPVDATTQAAIPIERTRLSGDAPDDPGTSIRPNGGRPDRSDRCFWLRPGRYRMALIAEGYRPSTMRDFDVVSEETCDLGEVLLAPLPAWRLRLTPASEEPLPTRLFVVARGRPDDSWPAGEPVVTPVAADGSATLRCDLPGRFLLDVEPDLSDRFSTGNAIALRLAVDRWPAEETREFALVPWRTVRVVAELSAIDVDLRDTRSWVRFEPLAATGAAPPPISARGINHGGQRVFLFRAPPGPYRLQLSGTFFTSSPLDVDVTDRVDAQEFRLVAQAK